MNIQKEVSHKVAEYLLQIKAVSLNVKKPFQWSSGLIAPIYCDNRIILSYPNIRTFIRQQFVDIINQTFGKPDVVVGVATGGIAHGVLVAQEFGLPFAYVRTEPKKHGLNKAIEGHIEKGQSVVIIEDLVSTGGSSIKAIQHLKDEGCSIKGMISIFTYQLKTSTDTFKKNKLQFFSLSNFEDLIKTALDKDYITEADYEQLKEWQKDPENWTPPKK